ncbi:MAG TPA: MFS transporter [Gaiellaceae bacterium]|nr:MFS transporter [Gaiellaceae bacterium]
MRRFALLRRAPDYRRLFLATLASGAGTYVAAVALTVDVFDRTGSGKWVSALLIAEFLPMVVVGLALAPFVDRFSRRQLMVASDLVRLLVFCLLPFAGSAAAVVALAFVAGFATGFFRPAVYAGLPNLVDDEELPDANALLQAVENLAWMIGPVAGGVLLAAQGPDAAYWLNAVSFLVSAVLLARIPARRLQAGTAASRGHLRDIGDGVRAVLASRALLLVLVVWNVVLFGTAAVNVAEVVLAKVALDAGDVGFGILVGASGLGLTVGSLVASPLLDRVGTRAAYAAAIALMAAGFGVGAVAPTLAVAAAAVVVATIGNGIAVVCNALLVQRGAPDDVRGRAFTVIMSSNYVLLGLGMAAAGPLVDAFGARWLWGAAAVTFAFASAVAFVLGRHVEEVAPERAPDGAAVSRV